MRRILTLAVLLFSFHAFADALRSDKHLIKIETQSLAQDSRQYNVQVFDAESRKHVAHLKVSANGDVPAEGETTADGTRYKVRIEPHGAAYLIEFLADDGTEVIDAMRGGFVPGKAKPAPSRAHTGREIQEPKVLRRIEPVYTEDAKAAGAAGTVVLEVVIDRSGFVQDATVVKPMGYGLSESAVDAVKQWQFEPSLQERAPVEVVHEVTIEFKP